MGYSCFSCHIFFVRLLTARPRWGERINLIDGGTRKTTIALTTHSGNLLLDDKLALKEKRARANPAHDAKNKSRE